jgi:Cys-rich repeat protein
VAARCVQCLAKADCAATPTKPLCNLQRGDRCVQCITGTDCNADAGTPICDKDRCVQCKDDKDCPGANPKCDNGTCQ